MNVVGAARGVEKIQELSDGLKNAKGSLTAVKCDLMKEEDIYNLFKTIKEKFGGVDVCVNNAGFSYPKSLLEGTPTEWKNMMNVNVIAVCLCSKLAIQSMKERGVDDGHIVNVSRNPILFQHCRSCCFNMPDFHFYTATKYALNAVSEGLRQEMRELKSHIRISIICPGAVVTEFGTRMYNDEEKGNELFTAFKCLQAEDIARSVLHIISSPAHVEINDIIIRPTEEPH
ncbi:Dehydrogenase/reductase SDR family member 11 [Armadillidium nasatum]|uniref:Dehydrogenase/reductase SDR family member 11 n=1 Tax=Armadillidium nasatum TaxID=96803 RepID=A0A5N5TJI5_9CRUS|nr:Dehydrogenase/reductase SDR family member 11 [Armadillidium nasatum]